MDKFHFVYTQITGVINTHMKRKHTHTAMIGVSSFWERQMRVMYMMESYDDQNYGKWGKQQKQTTIKYKIRKYDCKVKFLLRIS